ncbi:ABC transporter permease [Sulfitobacter sabulilitoris]|uniref:ABC transporter permease n=1 Tax=Sulfitobacter sabulilitoris TaxID=2562655 RepID=A0A5S3PD24_9RHOB|nr:ABC transporter permease [Sulfitobacter sabulilitoris]TMM51757.1 ABC transporter permease [Sulfitobacter sabulilitoris]
MRQLTNIFWLGSKELRSFFSDMVMFVFLIWSFTFSIYSEATGSAEDVNNASIAVVDEDRSALSRQIATAFYPPYFRPAEEIAARDVDVSMDQSRYMFVLVIPPGFERDVRLGRKPALQLNIDATAVAQAAQGAGYLQSIIEGEIIHFTQHFGEEFEPPVALTMRRAFNPNGADEWFLAINALLNNLSILTIVLTGAALLREREHGTIEHLLVMPLTSFQIAMAKVWANGLVILTAFTLSLLFVVEGLLEVRIAGSRALLLLGVTTYLFAAAAIGILLGTVARTMAQFALLILLTIVPMMMLSGGMSPIESQPDFIRPFTWLLPSRHFMEFAQAVVFRGATFAVVWPVLMNMAVLGAAFFLVSLLLFRRSITAQR